MKMDVFYISRHQCKDTKMSLSESTPDFCFITPINLLERYATQSSKHLCLAHLVDQSEVYANFYNNMRKRGDYVMMDCSAFELGQSYEPAKLLSLGKVCGANAIVLPDYPGQTSLKTIDSAKQWSKSFKDNGFDTFFVPQGVVGDLSDWLRAYDFAATCDDIDIIGMSILGIPNALPKIDRSFARVVMTQFLQSQERFSTKRHHYLGLNSGPALEIPSLINMNALWSVDSSNPVWMGMLGHEYTHNSDSFLTTKKIHFPVDFYYNEKIDQATHNRIQININLTKGLFK